MSVYKKATCPRCGVVHYLSQGFYRGVQCPVCGEYGMDLDRGEVAMSPAHRNKLNRQSEKEATKRYFADGEIKPVEASK